MRGSIQIGQRMKLRDLHYLLTVVQAGSMAKASSQLGVSQPVISKIIADMEHLLKVRLLDRSRNGVEPTIYGRRLLTACHGVFDEMRQGVIEVEHLADPSAGQLAFGSHEASTIGFVPAVVARLRRSHPNFVIETIITNTAEDQRRELGQRKIEFAIGRLWVPPNDLEFEAQPLFEQRLCVVAGAGNPWTRERRVRLRELAGPWVMPSPDVAAGQLVADVFRASGLDLPRISVTTSSLQVTAHLLEHGPYLALLPTSAVRPLVASGALRIVPVDLPTQPSTVAIMSLRSRRMSRMAEIFMEAAREIADSMTEEGT